MAKHILIFEGDVPEDEAARAEIHAHPDVKAAKQAMLDAFKKAGHPHTMTTKITKARKTGGGRKPRAVAPAAE